MRNGHVSDATAREIRERFNIPYSKINHYTDLGLFSIVRRDGNKRIYRMGEVERRYRVISRLANQGYPLRLIQKKLLGLIKDELL